MSDLAKKNLYTFEEYLALEEKAEFKSEFFEGEIFVRHGGSGGTRDHSLIGTNTSRELGNALRGKPCFVFNSDLMVQIRPGKGGFYPDTMVVCGEEQFSNEKENAITNPTVVVEVLSESTAAWDHGGKFRQYQSLSSLQEYVLVEQTEPQVNVYRRGKDGMWLLEGYAGLDAEVEFKSLGIKIASREIFMGVKF
jgi:Uma2 family endonuclease